MIDYLNSEFLALKELKILSEFIGRDKSLIQGAGGNTSIKFNKKLFVKASGTMLKRALSEEIFVSLSLDSIFNQLNNKGKLENDLEIYPLSNTSLKPSIETAFHAFMPHRIVLHCHAIDVIAHTICSELKNNLKYILKNYSWELIPYARPGYPLANLIIEAITKKKIDVLILQNHGLIIGANTVQEAKELQDKIVFLMKLKQRKMPTPDLLFLKNLSSKIPNSKLPKKNIIHSLATDKLNFKIAQKNPLYPDHVIFCGKEILILEPNNLKKEELNKFDYALVPDYGVIILKDKSEVLEEMLEMQALILSKLNSDKTITYISEIECNELLDWEQEKYRQKLINN